MKFELTREELYALVWSAPISKVAPGLGVSDVGLAKRCKSLNVPHPSRGYWAKMAAGKRTRKTPLPPTLDRVEASGVGGTEGRIPRRTRGLGPRAQALLAAIQDGSESSSDHKRVSLCNRFFPSVKVTMGMAALVARAFQSLLNKLEPTGVFFRQSRSKYACGFFEWKRHQLHLFIEEEVAPLKEVPTYVSGQSMEFEGPTGRLVFTLRTEREKYYFGWSKTWCWDKNGGGGLREVVVAVAEGVATYYRDLIRKRAEWEERCRVDEEASRRRQAVERAEAHERGLDKAMRTREVDLFRAAEWARIHRSVEEFIRECEARWRTAGSDITPDQRAWVEWARTAAEAWSPWARGYPDPGIDGAVDREAYPHPGPLPPVRKFPRPPTMPKVPVEPTRPH